MVVVVVVGCGRVEDFGNRDEGVEVVEWSI